jgi:D-threo-aldose 1-dehydrogenase
MKQAIALPPVIYGTSCLGNLYQATPYENKLAIIKSCMENAPGGIAVFDSAGKYGAGLALENLAKCLSDLNIPKEKVMISNKLGWYQTGLTTSEPTFEPGVWKNLTHDAVQKISYDGIIECFEQGNKLLGVYKAQMVSIHDPDEYLAAAQSEEDAAKRYTDIIEAYNALNELKQLGKVSSVGIGSKDWKVIRRISNDVVLDWVMIANSLTIYSHPKELIDFVTALHQKNVLIINSAVFNGGFLVGSDYYNYQLVDKESEQGKALYCWREKFYEICAMFDVQPAEACFNFGFNIPGVNSISLNTTKPENVQKNVAMATKKIPPAFWDTMRKQQLL